MLSLYGLLITHLHLVVPFLVVQMILPCKMSGWRTVIFATIIFANDNPLHIENMDPYDYRSGASYTGDFTAQLND